MDLSPAANAVWEAFNQDEAGAFVDYGDKLAAALRAAADEAVPADQPCSMDELRVQCRIRAIAAELEQ